jgi:predicted nucleic-acid-binding Zn-ribbon protein
MIFYWLSKLGDWVVWLFRPADPRDVAKISDRVPCPICGNRKAILRAVSLAAVKNGKPAQRMNFCQATCTRCGCRWMEEPVVSASPDAILPAIPRTALEEAEDKQYGQPASVSTAVAGAIH